MLEIFFYTIGFILLLLLIGYINALIYFGLFLPYFGYNAEVNKDGIKIFSKFREDIGLYYWDEISHIEVVFNPPLFHYPKLHLINCKSFKLLIIDEKEFYSGIAKNQPQLLENKNDLKNWSY